LGGGTRHGGSGNGRQQHVRGLLLLGKACWKGGMGRQGKTRVSVTMGKKCREGLKGIRKREGRRRSEDGKRILGQPGPPTDNVKTAQRAGIRSYLGGVRPDTSSSFVLLGKKCTCWEARKPLFLVLGGRRVVSNHVTGYRASRKTPKPPQTE